MNTSIVEADFGLNSFQNPKTIEDEEALTRTILMILFGKPGVFPSNPEVGLHVQDLFNQFDDDIDVNILKSKLAYQCSLVSEVVEDGSFDIRKTYKDDNLLLLFIIPSIIAESNNILVIGVTTNTDKSVVYNFDIMKSDFDN
jgi:hypothetical protein